MKLLNIVFCVLFVFTSYNTYAQKSNVQNAYRALEKKKIELEKSKFIFMTFTPS